MEKKFRGEIPFWLKNKKNNLVYICSSNRNITIAKKIVELTKDISKNGLLNGLGKPERLRHYKKAIYSRRITDEHRLVYDVFDDTVRVLSCEGHYKDKNFDEY